MTKAFLLIISFHLRYNMTIYANILILLVFGEGPFYGGQEKGVRGVKKIEPLNFHVL